MPVSNTRLKKIRKGFVEDVKKACPLNGKKPVHLIRTCFSILAEKCTLEFSRFEKLML
ncbi:hypothetical protein [Methanosarcina sp.]|uniref:hypothetical protein n=1 Tax=Methanosarcina sp. TaxID=2213 RepID=UPI002BDAE244|nr:hypothetical protein [Methanosarcina sp.]HOW15038.1 hypothetical protein [Methanosarcina sp.]